MSHGHGLLRISCAFCTPAAGLLAMTALLLHRFTVVDPFGEGAKLMAMPWGVVSLVDLYTGFALFSGWIFSQEKPLPALWWTLGSPTLGFWAGSL